MNDRPTLLGEVIWHGGLGKGTQSMAIIFEDTVVIAFTRLPTTWIERGRVVSNRRNDCDTCDEVVGWGTGRVLRLLSASAVGNGPPGSPPNHLTPRDNPLDNRFKGALSRRW